MGGGELRLHRHCFHCLDDQAGSFFFKLLVSRARNTEKVCTHTCKHTHIHVLSVMRDSMLLRLVMKYCWLTF